MIPRPKKGLEESIYTLLIDTWTKLSNKVIPKTVVLLSQQFCEVKTIEGIVEFDQD